MAKKWIKQAINPEHKGEFAAKAKAEGKSTAEYAKEKENAPGKTGKQARLATTLMGMHEHPKKSRAEAMYGKKD